MAKIKVTLIKSTLTELPTAKQTVAALGLKKIRQFAIHEDTPTIRGMIKRVNYLVKVEDVKEEN
jgi:large subunit ribosomal protein L30